MYTVDSSQEKFSVSKYNSFRMRLSGCDFFDRKREQIGPASNKKVGTAEPVLWSRSRKEPKLFVGAGTGAGAVIVKFRLRFRVKLTYYIKIIIHTD